MNTFEVVRGVEGDCLVLDGTRICGPKPWGGGRIIKTFHTDGIYEVINKDEYRKLMDDNAKLRKLVRLMWKPFCWAQSYGACLTDEQDAEIRDKVRELGVDE